MFFDLDQLRDISGQQIKFANTLDTCHRIGCHPSFAEDTATTKKNGAENRTGK
jgi:hypothetical protein